MYNFIRNNTTRGPNATKINYSEIYLPSGNYPYQKGDLMQFHDGSTWMHSAVIVGYTYVSGSSTTVEAIVTCRTAAGDYKKKHRQSLIYPGKSRRVLRLNGYYS